MTTIKLNKPIIKGFTTKLCKNEKEYKESIKIRMKVFVEEQGFTIEEELDQKDNDSDHFLLLHSFKSEKEKEEEEEEEIKVVGTIRWYPPLNKLGRLAVLKDYRGGGAGSILVKCLEDHLKSRSGKSELLNKGLNKCLIVANSQKYAIGFYEKQGFKSEGDEFLEDGELHMRMVKILDL